MRIESPISLPTAAQWHPSQTQSSSDMSPSLPALPTGASEPVGPAPGPQIPEPGDASLSLAQKIDAVLQQAGVDGLVTVIDGEAVRAQSQTPANTVSFEKALAAALTSFLTDDEDVESPLSLMSDTFENPSEELVAFLNDGTTKLQLVNSDMMGEDGGAYPAEHGESITDHWVFALTIPEFSDHLFWAIVPRDGEPAYNYGFN